MNAHTKPKAEAQSGTMMQATMSVKAIRDAMSKIGRAVARRTTIPILGTFRLMVAEGNLTITGTDLDIMASISIPVAEARKGSICVSARILILLRSLPNFDTIRIREVDGRRLVLDLPDGRVSLIAMDPDDFPEVTPKGGIIATFDMASSDFVTALERVRPFISDEDTRYYLNGIFFKSGSPGELALTATDGHVLGRLTIPLVGSIPELGFILPTGAIAFLLKTLPLGVGVKMACTAGYITITTEDGSFSLISKLIDGTFPDYNRVVPKEEKGVFEIAPAQWLAKLSRIIRFSGKAFKAAIFERNRETGRTSASSESPDYGEVVVALGSKRISGEGGFNFGMNPTLIVSALKSHRAEVVTMRFLDASSPTRFDSEGFMSLVMPMRVGSAALALPEGCEP